MTEEKVPKDCLDNILYVGSLPVYRDAHGTATSVGIMEISRRQGIITYVGILRVTYSRDGKVEMVGSLPATYDSTGKMIYVGSLPVTYNSK